MKAAIYCRVSTADQDLEAQEGVLREWAELRGLELVRTYREQESAWKGGHQQQLQELLLEAQRGKFKVVLVWALDRLSREGPLQILTLVHNLRSWGVKVLSHQEPWTEAPGELGDLLLALTGWVARMESQRRSERTKVGMERARREGRRVGRPKGSKDSKPRRRARA